MLDLIKKILSFSWVRKHLSPKKILIILTGVGAIVMLINWYRKRKAAQAQENQETKKITSSTLVKIWQEFIRRIPSEYRHAITLYQPVVVLGEAGVGKSLLIEKYTDWKGQSYQFYPSYTENPEMQIYLGSQVLVQEIPADILNDTSRETRSSLVNLWEYSFHKRTPNIIVAIKADSLALMTPDTLRRQAKTLRGKINIISQLYPQVSIKIVLTYMDHIEGFKEFSKLLATNEISFKIKLDKMAIEKELEKCLEPYETYLPLALTTMKSEEYKSLIHFFKQMPEVLSTTATFLQSLTERDPLAPSVQLDELFLESNTNKEQISNPFSATWPEEVLSSIGSTSWKHLAFRTCLLVLGAGILLTAYWYEQNHWHSAKQHLTILEKSPSIGLCGTTHQKLADLANRKDFQYLRIFREPFSKNYQQRLEDQFGVAVRNFYVSEWKKAQNMIVQFSQNPSDDLYAKIRPLIGEIVSLSEVKFLAPYLVGFSDKYEKDLQREFITALRNHYLIPLVAQSALSYNAHEKTLYILSVIYASKDNDLGKQILSNLSQWSRNLEISEQIIEDYVTYSETAWSEPIPLVELPKVSRHFEAADSPEPWIIYFIEMENTLQRSYITPEYLEGIKNDGKPLTDVIYYVGQYSLAQTLFDTLDRTTRLNVRKIYQPLAMTNWISKNNEALKEMFQMINEASLAVPSPEKYKNLPQLITNLKTVLSIESSPKVIEFSLEGKKFQFSASKWQTLLQHSKIVQLNDNFIEYNQDRNDILLLSGRNTFENIKMNRYNNGDSFISGKKEIEGRYTKEAYEREIKPTLEEFNALIQSLPSVKNKKNELSNFVFSKSKQYAYSYRKSYEEYYHSFGVQANSVPAFNIVLTQMQLPAAPFMDFLRTLVENTTLDTGTSLYLAPLKEHLAVFKPIQNLINIPDNNELQTYKVILQEIKEQLKDAPAKKDDKKKDKQNQDEEDFQEFVNLLSPVAKLTLPILLQEKDSYLAITQNWLKTVKITGEWQQPFLAPIHTLYDLGLKDIETVIQKNWQSRVYPTIAPILLQYPFNQKSERDVPPLELETILHPKVGKFWVTFRQCIAPACVRQNGTWKLRESLRKPIQVSKDTFAMINHLDMLARVLWDSNGDPKPLQLQIKPSPLPLPSHDKFKYATLASFTVGNATCFYFNQKPSWQDFPIRWWKQETTKVGLEYTVQSTGQKHEYSIAVHDSFWTFFKVLQKSKIVEKDTWTWNLPESASDYTTSKVTFVLSENPWRLFELPISTPTSTNKK